MRISIWLGLDEEELIVWSRLEGWRDYIRLRFGMEKNWLTARLGLGGECLID